VKRHKVYFIEKEKAAFVEEEVAFDPESSQVVVKSEYDVISAGTELANYHGLPNTGADGGFPVHVGYSVSGHVIAVGAKVQKLKAGDKVGLHWCGHRSIVVQNENDIFPIPEGIDMQDAAFMHLSSFPMLAIRKLEVQMGESVMVAGLGLLGMFAIQYAKISGACPVLACDYSPERRALALKLGADQVFDPREPGFIEKVKAATGGKGPECVVEVTGYISALQQALEYIAWEGRITLLGCTRISDQCIDFYKYVHRRGIRLIGCHTMTRPKSESRPGEWSEYDDYYTFFKLLKYRNLQVKPLVSRIVSPVDAEQVYHELGSAKNPPLGWLFDWREIDK